MGNPIDPRPGRRLQQIREHRNMSQGQLARAIGVSVGTIQNHEHGRVHITVDRLEELARALQ
jgi:transcriptional regulator with XRE-family HTH domain